MQRALVDICFRMHESSRKASSTSASTLSVALTHRYVQVLSHIAPYSFEHSCNLHSISSTLCANMHTYVQYSRGNDYDDARASTSASTSASCWSWSWSSSCARSSTTFVVVQHRRRATSSSSSVSFAGLHGDRCSDRQLRCWRAFPTPTTQTCSACYSQCCSDALSFAHSLKRCRTG